MQTNRTRVDSAMTFTDKAKTKGFLTGSVLRIREGEPLWPANVAAELLTLELASDPSAIDEEIALGYLPESCREVIRPIDVYRMRQKFGARIGVSQRSFIRSKYVKIID